MRTIASLKPTGMATHGRGSNTLLDALRREVATCDDHLWQPVYRLDFGTRGPVCVAKTSDALRELQADWHLGEKTHHAWLQGVMSTSRGAVNLAIEGKRSQTTFKPWAAELGVHEVQPRRMGIVDRKNPSNPTPCRRHGASRGGRFGLRPTAPLHRPWPAPHLHAVAMASPREQNSP